MEKQTITANLTTENQTLRCFSHRQSGWQRDVTCAITFENVHKINSFYVTDMIALEESAIYLWLCYLDQPFIPLQCGTHLFPVYGVEHSPARQRLTYSIRCGANCFQRSRKMALVLVQCHQNRYEWTLIEGHFRQFGKSIVGEEKKTKEKSNEEQILEHLFTKIASLESEITMLKERVALLESVPKEEMDYFLS